MANGRGVIGPEYSIDKKVAIEPAPPVLWTSTNDNVVDISNPEWASSIIRYKNKVCFDNIRQEFDALKLHPRAWFEVLEMLSVDVRIGLIGTSISICGVSDD